MNIKDIKDFYLFQIVNIFVNKLALYQYFTKVYYPFLFNFESQVYIHNLRN